MRAMAVLGLAALVAAPAHAGRDTLADLLPGNALEGSRLFSEKGCLACHTVHGVGGTGGPDLGRGVLNRPLLEIAGVMWNHTPGMEHSFQERKLARPTFEASEMASLLAFLYYLGSLDEPGDPVAGERVFREKRCVTCHAVRGRGGQMGRALDSFGRYASPLYLSAALWRSGPAMAREMVAMRVPRPVFEGNDVPDLLAYLRSQAGGTERIYARPGRPKRGAELFVQKHCADCHAVRGQGPRKGPDLGHTLKGSLMRIAGAMWNHGPNMWARMAERGLATPSLTTEELSDLVSYLYFFQFIDPPGNAARGEAVYREKRCATCHEWRGPEQFLAPALTDAKAPLKTSLEVITAMWNHAGQMEVRMAEANVAWPLLKGGEMADLIAYLLSTRPDAAPPVKAP